MPDTHDDYPGPIPGCACTACAAWTLVGWTEGGGSVWVRRAADGTHTETLTRYGFDQEGGGARSVPG